MTQKEWTTKATKNLKKDGKSFTLRGFQGVYEVIVRKDGEPVQRETFTVGKEDTTVNIAVTQSTSEFLKKKTKKKKKKQKQKITIVWICF